MSEYLVVIEKSETNYAAFSPDLPGCIATGATKQEAIERMRQAIALHIQGLEEDGLPIPESSSSAEYLSV